MALALPLIVITLPRFGSSNDENGNADDMLQGTVGHTRTMHVDNPSPSYCDGNDAGNLSLSRS